MKYFTIIVSVFFVFFITAQQPIPPKPKSYSWTETTFHLGDTLVMERSTMKPITGLIVHEDEDNNKVFECNFINGKKDGTLTIFNALNKPLLIATFKNGKPNGSFQCWFDDGSLAAKCYFANGAIDGNYQQWYSENHQLWIDENYQKGKLFGQQRYFSKDGKSLGGGDLRNGQGHITLYDENNKLLFQGQYVNSLLDGKVFMDSSYWEYSKGIMPDSKNNAHGQRRQLTDSMIIDNPLIDKSHDNEMVINSFFLINASFQFLKFERIIENEILVPNKRQNFCFSFPYYPNCKLNVNQKARNPFGDGGNGGGKGGGNDLYDGNGRGTGGEGDGEGDGFGDGKSRIRINNPVFPKYNTDVDLKIHLKLTVSGDGDVSTAVCIKSKTTTTDQTIINDVIREVIKQVKYKKDPEGRPSYCFLTVKINAP
jgi:antitoxin component YwqK of YwqJK toxin-antitoxin module